MKRENEEANPEQSVDRAMAKGAFWMVLAKLSERSLGVISTIILVRLLAPTDFGLVAMGMSVIAICELIGQVGLDVALIQNSNATRHHYDTAWTFNVILGVVIASLLVLLASPAARFYSEPRLAPIIMSLALGSLISGFENIGVVAFRKDLHFHKEFQFLFGKKLAAFLLTMTLAIVLRNYWALIGGIILNRVAGVCLSYYLQGYRPRWSMQARRELFHFSKWLVIHNVAGVFNSRAADFIVGKVAGAHALGVFSISYELSNLPTSELTAPINRAVYPFYARKSADTSALKQGYLDVIGMMVAVGVPIGVGIAATAPVVVPLLFGPKWNEAIPVVTVLAFYGVLAAMRANSHCVYLAQGKPEINSYLAIGMTLLLLPLLGIMSVKYGVMGAAYAYVISDLASNVISFAVLFYVLAVTVGEIVSVLWRPVLAAALMFTIVRLVAPMSSLEPFNNLTGIMNFTTAVTSGALTYVTCLYVFWLMSGLPVGPESRILDFLQWPRVWSWVRGTLVLSR